MKSLHDLPVLEKMEYEQKEYGVTYGLFKLSLPHSNERFQCFNWLHFYLVKWVIINYVSMYYINVKGYSLSLIFALMPCYGFFLLWVYYFQCKSDLSFQLTSWIQLTLAFVGSNRHRPTLTDSTEHCQSWFVFLNLSLLTAFILLLLSHFQCFSSTYIPYSLMIVISYGVVS